MSPSVTSSSSPRPRLIYVPVIILGWAVFTGLMSAQHVMSGAFAWDEAWRMTMSQWLPWAVVSPFILWLVSAYPVERPDWKLRALVHGSACVLVVCLCARTGDYLMPPPPESGRMEEMRRADPPPPGPPPGQMSRNAKYPFKRFPPRRPPAIGHE